MNGAHSASVSKKRGNHSIFAEVISLLDKHSPDARLLA